MKPVSKEVSLSPTVKTIPKRLKRFVVGVVNKAGFEWEVKEKRNFAQIGSFVIDVQRNPKGRIFGKDNTAQFGQMCPAAENRAGLGCKRMEMQVPRAL